MTPVQFKMVDLDGIDLAEINGTEVPGIYNKILGAYNTCRVAILCNWFFAGILLPPAHVLITMQDTTLVINDSILVSSDDRVYLQGVVPQPVLSELTARYNGVFTPSSGVDGFSKVIVEVPMPTIESITITENGVYEHNFGGFNPVTVNVPSVSEIITPIHTDANNGYLASGNFTYENNSTTRYDVFQVESGKVYLCILGSSVGNRFRASFFTSDPFFFTENASGTRIGSDSSSPTAYMTKPGYTAPSNGYIAIAKTNESQNGIVSRVIDISSL